MALVIGASLLGLWPLPVLAQTVAFSPDHGLPGSKFTATYDWSGCPNYPDGTIEIFWNGAGVKTVLIGQLSLGAKPSCAQSLVDAVVPATATAGVCLKCVEAVVVDSKSIEAPGSSVFADFTVDVPPTPTPHPTPTPPPTPVPTATPTPPPTPPSAPRPGTSPVPTPGASALPRLPGTPTPTPPPGTPTPTPPPGSGALAPAFLSPSLIGGQPEITVSAALPSPLPIDNSINARLAGFATSVSSFAGDTFLGGLTDLILAIIHGSLTLAGNTGPNLSNVAATAVDPDVAASDRNVYVVWSDDSIGNSEVFFSLSRDHGYTFDVPVNLSHNAGASEHPRVAAIGDQVSVAWDDSTPGNTDVLFASSNDGGLHWTEPTNLSNNAGSSANPVIAIGAAAGGAVSYVAWEDSSFSSYPEIAFRSTSSSTIVHLSTNQHDARRPRIAAQGANIELAWESNPLGDWDVNLARSGDGGGHWDSSTLASGHSTYSDYGDDVNLTVAASGSNVVWAFEKNREAHRWISLGASPDNGQSFVPYPRSAFYAFNFDVTYTVTDSTFSDPMTPAVAADGSTWYLAYIFALNTPAGRRSGLNFGSAGRPGTGIVYGDEGTVANPLVVVAAGHPVVLWEQHNGASEIFSVDMTVGLGSAMNMSDNAGASTTPRAASSGANLTAVWSDTTDGLPQVYFRTIPIR